MCGTIMTKNKTLYNLEIYRIDKEGIYSLFSINSGYPTSKTYCNNTAALNNAVIILK